MHLIVPGCAITSYLVITEDPVDCGATQVTLAPESMFDVAVTEVGAPGVVTGMIGSLSSDAELSPEPLRA
jgi:hypothetical protein